MILHRSSLTFTEYSFTGNSPYCGYEFTINKRFDGEPFGYGYTGNHAMVVYGCCITDRGTTNYLVHIGYRSYPRDVWITEYGGIFSSFYITYNDIHYNHGYHFFTNNINDYKVCGCGQSISHCHIYDNNDVSFNETYHYAFCWCGALTLKTLLQ
ncbi:MAG: hypothetical protein PHV87_02930 [Bacilli bacterium]|nr:hypothetical protein [Bacilli bacterium]